MALFRDDFEAGRPITQVPVDWFNAVANWLNNFTGGFGIRVERDNDPPSVSIDQENIKNLLAIPTLCPSAASLNPPQGSGITPETPAVIASRHPEDIQAIPPDETDAERQEREISDIGSSKLAARVDHVHRISTDIGENPVEEGSLVCADASVIDQGEETLWEAGGENGCKLQVFFDGDPEGEEGISHTFYAAELTIGKMGNIVKVERVRHGGAKFTS